MNLRAPSVPLITIDPYFSVWSGANKLTDNQTVHWTGKNNTIIGKVEVDGKCYRFMGVTEDAPIAQTGLEITALGTEYTFECDEIVMKALFTTPLLPDNLTLMSRPVSYLKLSYKSKDKTEHTVKFSVAVSEEICLNEKGQSEVEVTMPEISGVKAVKIGNREQKVLNRSGDDVRIDWGYFYLAVKADKSEVSVEKADMTFVKAEFYGDGLVLFAYDDISSISYFGEHLKSLWNKNGMTIEAAIEQAHGEYDKLVKKCDEFSASMYKDAVSAGGEKYAEILSLAYRQVIAAHKIAVDGDGELLFISKECFSNGCAATVDVSYPSIPMFLHYNPELVKGMMRPVFKYAASEDWPYDFSPHDVGRYPILGIQHYGYKNGEHPYHMQMPVEESGNMLIMAAATAIAQGNTSFIKDNIEVLEKWAKYLIEYGQDPENQLCTDDFAGHLAHNCNLSLKAIMGLAGLSILFKMMGQKRKSADYMKKSKDMADIWVKTAANGDGSFKLAFDKTGTYSMKYNAVWDKLFGTEIFAPQVFQSELFSNKKRVNPYGMPLDNRASYTKSDWLVWTATMFNSKEDFEEFIAPLWKAYHYSPSRVPLTDWYDTITSIKVGFQHRTVQGGLYIKLMEEKFTQKSKKIIEK